MRIKSILAVAAASLALAACETMPDLNFSGPPRDDLLLDRAAGAIGVAPSRLTLEGLATKHGMGSATSYIVRLDDGRRWACQVNGGDALEFTVSGATCNPAA